jgi:hypothetical protein
MRTATRFLLALALPAIATGQPSIKTITEEYPDRFSTETSSPRFYDKTPVAEAADKAIGDWVSKTEKEFNASALKQIRDLGVPTDKYESKTESEVTFYSPKKLISVTCDHYEYLGGAHGISTYRVFNFGGVRGKVKQVTLGDLFKRGSSFKTQVTQLVLGKLKENEDATLVQSGEVKALNDQQLNRFQMSPDGLTFLFDHYEVAPYSNGRFKVTLSLEELGPDFEWAKILAE